MTNEFKKVPLTMIELFSGIGAQKQGVDMTDLFDLKVIATSDIEKDAIVSYAAIHDELTNELVKNYENYPIEEEMKKQLIDRNIGYDFKKETNPIARLKGEKLKKYYLAMILSNNLGDISKIEELPYADFWTYSFPCFVEGTLVLTRDGYKQIEEITQNDYVLTHTNRYQKVVKPMINQANKLIKIDSMPSESLHVTENHPFYVRKKHNLQESKTGRRYREFDSPEWIKAKELTKEYYVGTAINQESKLPIWDGSVFKWSDGRKDRKSNIISDKFKNNDFWYLIGRYIGDGWIRSGGGIIICANDLEIGQILEKLDTLDFNYSITKETTINKIHISFKEIGEYCEQFGRGAANKHLTSDILDLPIDKLKAFIEGYIASDGTFTQGKYKICSVSRKLIYEVGQCIAKAYNIPFSVYFTQRAKTTIIEGRVVNQKDTYQITFSNETKPQAQAFFENGYIWSPIRNVVTEEYDGLVYNLEVENDNSYVVQNIIVHNCTDISVAGNQAGLKSICEDCGCEFEPMSIKDIDKRNICPNCGSEKLKGTRSGLLKEVEKLLSKAKETNTLPKYLLLENVKNLVGKQFKQQFGEWVNTLSDLGFNTYYEVTNAKNCGIPQNRERVFALSIRKDVDTKLFKFAKPYDLGYRLKDFLDEEVDEKYYIATDKVNTLLEKLENSNFMQEKKRLQNNDNVCSTLLARDYKDPKLIDCTEKRTPVRIGNIYGEQFGTGYAGNVWDKDGISPTLTTMQGGGREPHVIEENSNTEAKVMQTEHSQWKQEMCEKFIDDAKGIPSGVYTNQSKAFGYRPPLKGYPKTLKANANDAGAVVNKRVRKLTPKECWRLMGFADECYDKSVAVGISDSAGYKQAGNSIVTTCIKQIMEHLYKAQYDNTYVCFDENFTQPQED